MDRIKKIINYIICVASESKNENIIKIIKEEFTINKL